MLKKEHSQNAFVMFCAGMTGSAVGLHGSHIKESYQSGWNVIVYIAMQLLLCKFCDL